MAKQLQGEVMRFADQYSGVIAQGLDDFANSVGTPKIRAQALDRKVNQASAAITIASGPNPVANLLDMVVLVSLTRMSQEDYWVAKAYGEKAQPLLDLLGIQEAQVWRLAAEHLTAEQLQQLHALIDAWRRRYPEMHYTAFQHFTEFAAVLGVMAEKEKTRKGNIFGLLSVDPLSNLKPAVRQIEQTRYLAERVMYYGQRAPILLQWRAELIFLNFTAMPETQQVLSMSERWTKTVEQLPGLVDREREAAIKQFFEGLANEHTNIINSLMARETQATDILTNLQATLETGRGTAVAWNELVQSSDGLLQNNQERKERSQRSGSTNSRPFDIREYSVALSNATAAATALSATLNSGSQELPKLKQSGKQLANYIFILAVLLVVVIGIVVLAYRWLVWILFKPGHRSAKSPPSE